MVRTVSGRSVSPHMWTAGGGAEDKYVLKSRCNSWPNFKMLGNRTLVAGRVGMNLGSECQPRATVDPGS